MKNAMFFPFLLFIVSVSFSTGCTTETLDYTGTARENISQGKWSVDYCFADQDKTSQFSKYQFNFIGNGTLLVSNDSSSVSGSWSMVKDVNYNEVLRINIDKAYFQTLNNQWTVTGNDVGRLTMSGADRQLRFRKL